MSLLAGEKVAVQNPLVRYAEASGWTRRYNYMVRDE